MSKFKAGQKAKVLRAAESFEDGWQNTWVEDMDKQVGKTLVVCKAPSYRQVERNVLLSDGYGYPEFVLEAVKTKRVAKKKARPRYAKGKAVRRVRKAGRRAR